MKRILKGKSITAKKFIRQGFMLSLLFILFLSALTLTACAGKDQTGQPQPPDSKQATANSEPSPGQDLAKDDQESAFEPVIMRLPGGDYGNLTPFLHYQRGPGLYKMNLVYDSLLEHGPNGMIPWLAQSWDIGPDNKTYTFKLVEGAKWHDGTPLTAADVVFSLEYFSLHPSVFHYIGLGDKSIVESAQAINDREVEIVFREALATNIINVGNQRILPRHIWENVVDPFAFEGEGATIGSGPYRLLEYSKEKGLYRLEAVEDYWGPKQMVSEFQFIPVSDEILAFNQGDIDLANLKPDLLAAYESNPELKIQTNPAFWGYRLIYNFATMDDFHDLEIRQAFAHAINYEELIEKVERGAAVLPSMGYLPTDHVDYNPAVKKYDYNPDRARELLADKNLRVKLITGNDNKEARIGELLKIQLEAVGVKLDLQALDSKTRDAKVYANDYELALFGHGGWGNDPDILRSVFTPVQTQGKSPILYGIPGYNNEELNLLARAQAEELDPAQRQALVGQMQVLISEDLPVIPLYNTTSYVLYKPGYYDFWKYMYDHHETTHAKLSYFDFGK